MIPVLPSAAIAQVDTRAQQEAHIPELLLMESAGIQAFQLLEPYLAIGDRIVVIAGGGNNGGDALVLSRYAYNAGFTDQRILLLSTTLSEATQVQKQILSTYPIEFITLEAAAEAIDVADWIVDGITGTGLSGALRPSLHPLVTLINESEAKVLSIDIPSGIGDTIETGHPAIIADLLVTMGGEKIACYHPKSRAFCGEITVVNPTFPPNFLEEVPPVAYRIDRLPKLTPLGEEAYKNTRGHLGIWGGSAAYSGALRLAGRAAFASRVGLVTVHCDSAIHSIVATESPAVMVRENHQIPQRPYDALLIGPGWGAGREELLAELLALKRPTVLDADGIRAYSKIGAPAHKALILTPHLGELKALLGEEVALAPLAFIEQIKRLARLLEATLVVKSSLVYIVSPAGVVGVVEGRNPSLGVAGSGDLLGGIIASLLAQGNDLLISATEGVLLHQWAAVAAHDRYGYYDAEQLAEQIGIVVKEAER